MYILHWDCSAGNQKYGAEALPALRICPAHQGQSGFSEARRTDLLHKDPRRRSIRRDAPQHGSF